MSNEKLWFVEDGILFCNTLFLRDEIPKDEKITAENSEPTKSWYEISEIESSNVVGIKGCCRIQMKSYDCSIIQVSFTELVQVKKDYLRASR